MPKIAKELTAIEVKRLNTNGTHFIGGVAGLILQVSNDGKAKSWLLRTRVGGKRQHIGLGPYPQTSLAEAKVAAKIHLTSVKSGANPLAEKKSVKSRLIANLANSKTFKECAEAYMDAKSGEYSNDKHRKQWASTLKTYAYPFIGQMLVADISKRNVLDVLEQVVKDKNGKIVGDLWRTKTATAERLQGRIKTVMDYAIVSEYRTTLNPAQWDGYLDSLLPSPKKIKPIQNLPSMSYKEVGDFMSKLRTNLSISAKALEFLIYSGFRSGSVRLAQWLDIDFDDKVWNIPADETKTKVDHRVPLSPQAIKFLKTLKQSQHDEGIESPYIFPSPTGKPLSDMALSEIMRGMLHRGEIKQKAVPHGFRSTFRTWLAEQTRYPDEIRKAANGHKVSDAIVKTYERTDFFDKRRELMNEWSKFLDQPSAKKPTSNTVISLRKRA